MMKNWKWNPKTKGSGIITCIPQTGICPNKCEDCFFQSGRSYLEPLDENLPHIPDDEMTEGRIVRMNDGNDSNVNREEVERVSKRFKDYFFNTAIPKDLDKFSGPVVLTVNPGDMTDTKFHVVLPPFPNLMFVRIRTNEWNISSVVQPAVEYYARFKIPIVLTFMAYFTEKVKEGFEWCYEWKKRTINSYWVPRLERIDVIMDLFKDNPYVYSCGVKGQHSCKFCGNCVREYYNTKERMRAFGVK